MISVIIPAYNEEKYIEATLRSVKSQNISHEIIVVCNGCTDNTAKVSKPFADRVIVLKERGVSHARNVGASVASFDTLVFLDADTRLSKNVLVSISKCSGFGTARAGSDSKKIKDDIFFFFKYLLQFFYSSAGLIFCSKSIYNKVGGFSKKMSKFEDGLFLKSARSFGKYHVVFSPVFTSTRRYQKRGYLGTVLFWIHEYFFPSKKEYEAVR